jgi:outer membrane immunogenic protein
MPTIGRILFMKSKLLSLLLVAGSALGQQQIIANNQPVADVPVFSEATGANVPTVPPTPPASSSYNWTGWYVGGHGGYASGNANTRFAPLPDAATFVNLAPQTLKPDPSGAFGGGQFGYNRQWGSFVLGVEADISFASIAGTKTVTPIIQNNGTPFPGAGFVTAHQDTDWLGTVRPRFGVAVIPRLLVYGTGGLVYGHTNYSADSDFRPVGTEHYPAAFDKTKAGWTVGAGAEAGINNHFTVKFDYLFYDLGTRTATVNPAIPLPPFQVKYTWQTRAQTIRGGVNFRF